MQHIVDLAAHGFHEISTKGEAVGDWSGFDASPVTRCSALNDKTHTQFSTVLGAALRIGLDDPVQTGTMLGQATRYVNTISLPCLPAPFGHNFGLLQVWVSNLWGNSLEGVLCFPVILKRASEWDL